MKLYLARHGQTDWNINHIVQGRTDVPLNETGLAQAHELAEALDGAVFDLALVSPLQRALVTCRIVCEKLQIPYRICEELTEQNFGIFEGASTRDLVYMKEKAKFFSRFPEGESFLDVAARIYPFLDDLAAQYPDGRILVVSHNGICRVIHSYFEDMTNDAFLNFRLGNCEIRSYESRGNHHA